MSAFERLHIEPDAWETLRSPRTFFDPRRDDFLLQLARQKINLIQKRRHAQFHAACPAPATVGDGAIR